MSHPSTPQRHDFDGTPAPLHQRLLERSQSINSGNLPSFQQWKATNRPVGTFTGNLPTYVLKLDYNRCDEFGSQTHMVNDALEKCFGQRAHVGWTIWINGDHLTALLRELRDEYESLLNDEAESKNLLLLDMWMERLLEELEKV